jgi:hypothetical protein
VKQLAGQRMTEELPFHVKPIFLASVIRTVTFTERLSRQKERPCLKSSVSRETVVSYTALPIKGQQVLQTQLTRAVDENGLNSVHFAFHVKQRFFGVRNVFDIEKCRRRDNRRSPSRNSARGCRVFAPKCRHAHKLYGSTPNEPLCCRSEALSGASGARRRAGSKPTRDSSAPVPRLQRRSTVQLA